MSIITTDVKYERRNTKQFYKNKFNELMTEFVDNGWYGRLYDLTRSMRITGSEFNQHLLTNDPHTKWLFQATDKSHLSLFKSHYNTLAEKLQATKTFIEQNENTLLWAERVIKTKLFTEAERLASVLSDETMIFTTSDFLPKMNIIEPKVVGIENCDLIIDLVDGTTAYQFLNLLGQSLDDKFDFNTESHYMVSVKIKEGYEL
jgi:hypothetical protein